MIYVLGARARCRYRVSSVFTYGIYYAESASDTLRSGGVPSGAPVLSHRPQTKPHHSTCVCVGEIEASRLFAHVFRPLNVSAGRGRRGSGGGYSPNPFDDVDDESDGISAEGNGCLFFFPTFLFCMLYVAGIYIRYGCGGAAHWGRPMMIPRGGGVGLLSSISLTPSVRIALLSRVIKLMQRVAVYCYLEIFARNRCRTLSAAISRRMRNLIELWVGVKVCGCGCVFSPGVNIAARISIYTHVRKVFNIGPFIARTVRLCGARLAAPGNR